MKAVGRSLWLALNGGHNGDNTSKPCVGMPTDIASGPHREWQPAKGNAQLKGTPRLTLQYQLNRQKR